MGLRSHLVSLCGQSHVPGQEGSRLQGPRHLSCCDLQCVPASALPLEGLGGRLF
jgi:hypothetical protein